MAQNAPNIDASRILRTLPIDQGFHFTTEKGETLGVTAISLSDFAAKLGSVDANSIFYHYRYGHFQKWIKYTLGDDELANRISRTKRRYFKQPAVVLEELRTHLLGIVQKRLSELQPQSSS